MTRQYTPESTYRFLSDRTILVISVAFLMSHVLDGPVRYVLFLANADSLLYMRDVGTFAVFAAALASWWKERNTSWTLVVATSVLLLHALIGAFSLDSIYQPLMALKIFLAFLFGVSLAPVVPYQALMRLSWVVFVVSCVGVIVNQWIEYPWVGMTYETAFGETAGSRLWWQLGRTRLAGFSRASICTASYVLLSLVPLYLRAGWLQRALLVAAGAYSLYLTTTKGVWLGLVTLLVGDFLIVQLRSRRAFAAFAVVVTLGCLALPIAAVNMPIEQGPVSDLAESFMMRIEMMWPRAFQLIVEPQQWIWGRGLGGIGVPQGFGDRSPVNTADNMMVYILVSFGIAGLIYTGIVVVRVLARVFSEPDESSFDSRFSAGLLFAWIAYGYMGNMFEEAVLNVAIGFVVGGPCFAGSAVHSAQPLLAFPRRSSAQEALPNA